jgi:hypothetical protein
MAVPPEQTDVLAGEETAASTNRTRLLLIAGGAVLLLLLVWFFFLRSSGEEEPLDVTVPPPAATPIESPTPSPTNDEPLETFDVFAAKDPFEPAISGGGGTEGGESGGEDAGGEDTGDTGDTGDEGTTPSGGDAGGGEAIGGHRVRVVDVVRNGRAQIQVDGTVYTVDEGETFADNFQLVSASGDCATMLFGDDEFTLCEGEEILK